MLEKQNSVMLVDDILEWYEKNVNVKLTKAFINFLIKIGIIKKDLDLEEINLFLLERYGEEYAKEGNFFKIKKNRLDVLKKYSDKTYKENVDKKIIEQKKADDNNNIISRKFKIENLGGKKLKLVKV